MTTPTKLVKDEPTTPISSKKQMSASLRERLQRSSRYYRSPLTPKQSSSNQSSSVVATTPQRMTQIASKSSQVGHYTNDVTETATVDMICTKNVCSDVTAAQHIDCGIGYKTPVSVKSRARIPNQSTPEISAEVTPVRLPVSKMPCISTREATPVNSKHKSDEEIFVTPKIRSNRQRLSRRSNSPAVKKRCVGANLFDDNTAGTIAEQKPGKDVNNSTSLISNSGDNMLTSIGGDAATCEIAKELAGLRARKLSLEQALHEKKEKLRKLRMVKLYKTKDEQVAVPDLISKWKSVSQQAILELHAGMPSPSVTLTEFIDNLQLDHRMIGYVAEEETFATEPC